MSYLVDKFKGKYRLLTPYDLQTNQFPRDLNGNYDDSNIYISCQRGIQIFHYGHGVLDVYIPSISIGRNILRDIYYDHINPKNSKRVTKEIIGTKGQPIQKSSVEIKNKDLFDKDIKALTSDNIIWDVIESDIEVNFKFNIKNFDLLVHHFKPKTSGASISPFSTKNLPMNKEFKIPENELLLYKEVTQSVPKDDALKLGQLTNAFIKTLTSKTITIQDIKADMKLKGLKGKNYIYEIGKWNEFLNYISENI